MPESPPLVIVVDPEHPQPDALEPAVGALRRGRLVAFPTETVYGLGADALDLAAVESIFAAKGRPPTDPLIVHVLDLAQAEGGAVAGQAPQQLVRGAGEERDRSIDAEAPGPAQTAVPLVVDVPEVARRLADAFWPGPLTLILPRGPAVPDAVTAGLATVAVRAPSHPVARALIAAFGGPIAAPSANTFGNLSPTRAEHVAGDLGGRVDVIVDAGATAVGVESSIVDCTVDPPRLLRPGGVPLEKLRRVVADLEGPAEPRGGVRHVPGAGLATGVAEKGSLSEDLDIMDATSGRDLAQKAPGQLARHYAPRAPMVLIAGSNADVREVLVRLAAALTGAGKTVGLLLATEDQAAIKRWPPGATPIVLGRIGHPGEGAHTLFEALHRLNDADVEVILARDFGLAGMARALRDRLTRGAEGRVVRVAAGGAEEAVRRVRRMVDG